MKKIILSVITLTSFFSLSIGIEANIKVGYDFFRYSNFGNIDYWAQEQGHPHREMGLKENINYERGFVLGAEILPFTFIDERIKFGLGLEYNFGEQNIRYGISTIKSHLHRGLTMIPVYATAKFTYYRPKNIDLNLYTFARLGYAFGNEHNRIYGGIIADYIVRYKDGIYFGFGLGLDYKYFLAEILYDGRYKYERKYVKDEYPLVGGYYKDYHHKLGIRLGVQLGTQHFKKVKIVEKIVEVPQVVKKKTTNKTIIKNFDISAEALFGFNKYKLSDLKEGGKQEIEEKVKELQKSGFEITGINVIGHTDRLGTDEYNYKLGLNRANTIAKYLKELGIKVEIKSSSKGKSEPKVYCDDITSTSKLKECLQPNRRVELQFIGFETEKKVEEIVETGN